LTKALGQAVTADKQPFPLRYSGCAQAQALGNLKTTPQPVVVVTRIVDNVEQRSWSSPIPSFRFSH
jgi:hypothetical protein